MKAVAPLLTPLLFLLLAQPALAALQVGDAAPDFAIPASFAGKTFSYSLKDALRKGPVVVYFYPAAYTSGCNLQAHTFAIHQSEFAAVGASIVGVSLDSIERLNEFSADPEYCAGKIPVASDAQGRVACTYDVGIRTQPVGRKDTHGNDIDHDLAERTSFVVGQNGRIVATIGGLAPAANVEEALRAVQTLATEGGGKRR
jgi:thioredoxin-dependent peroxiredoxin